MNCGFELMIDIPDTVIEIEHKEDMVELTWDCVLQVDIPDIIIEQKKEHLNEYHWDEIQV